MSVYDWLSGVPVSSIKTNQYVEVRFKNIRKDYYLSNINIQPGDLVVVQDDKEKDIGTVSLTGSLANIQYQKRGTKNKRFAKKILRKATQEDIDLWAKAKEREHKTKVRARELALESGLRMKVSDVEFSGDNTKATFYYTADGRIDFRELVKKLASTFRVRIEMKQIGARQEAGMVGAIGSCGRELCCSSWLKEFRTVSIGVLRYQQLSINSEKMAGQCGKLKCCLNFELDSYLEAIKDFPSPKLKLKTKKGIAVHFKSDILGRRISYRYIEDAIANPITLSLEEVNNIIRLNKKNVLPDSLISIKPHTETNKVDFQHNVSTENLERFDKKRKSKKRRRPKNKVKN